jgi:hypothetical protein
MKALSLRQPWAHAVLHLGKTIENRVWSTSFRGEFLLHAAKGMTVQEYEDAVDFCEDVLGLARCFEIDAVLGEDFKDARMRLPFGGIVGRARLVDVVPPRPEIVRPSVEAHYPPGVGEKSRWHMREQYGFVLADVRPMPFVPWKGALGFFDVPDDYATRGP